MKFTLPFGSDLLPKQRFYETTTQFSATSLSSRYQFGTPLASQHTIYDSSISRTFRRFSTSLDTPIDLIPGLE